MPKCPNCGNDLEYVGKADDATEHGHHAKVFQCNNRHCHRDKVYGGVSGS